MHRFYIPPENWNPSAPVLRESEVHHARDVLRLKLGEKAVLFNGRGREMTAEALEIGRAEIRFRKLHESETPPLRCRITLGQAIPKGKNMDLIVQKAVEIGAAEIVPLISERTIVDIDPKDAAQKQSKWQQVAIEAAKQCGQNWLPEVRPPQKLKDFFASPVGEPVSFPSPNSDPPKDGSAVANLRLIGSLQSDAQHLKKILTGFLDEHGDRPTNVLMLVGPEGDFTPAELSLARTKGCQPITLGPIILRVETAAIYCLSVLSYELL
ncbi:MAG TPA: 16S rRNA (uracil(1498)-N(3))-methyltransferase [Chthoniobacterales bacterium]|jgi:16S rRNA (uracil1498-N3)-methyltransferase